MSLAKLSLACGLTALVLSACGIAAKPLAGTAHLNTARGNHAQVDDPRTKHLPCLRSHDLPLRLYRTQTGARPAIQVGTLPDGPTIVFEPTPGDAQGMQITGQAPAAEVIGSALVYPNLTPDGEMNVVEGCVAIGVTG